MLDGHGNLDASELAYDETHLTEEKLNVADDDITDGTISTRANRRGRRNTITPQGGIPLTSINFFVDLIWVNTNNSSKI